MNKRYLIGGGLVIVFVVVAILSLNESKVDYENFETASTGETVQVAGVWIKEKETNYDSDNNKFTFYMKDRNEKVTKVVYDGAKPNNFELAESIVIKGEYKGDHFQAKQILTKCPSKYEGTVEELKNS